MCSIFTSLLQILFYQQHCNILYNIEITGYQLTKTYGQHLLTNPNIINTIIEKSDIKPSSVILEIGPGSGNLTIQLAEVAAHVIAIEIDKRMVSELRKRIPPHLINKITIINADFTKMNDVPPFDMCISNCPYNVSSAIIFKLLALSQVSPRCKKFVLMFQLEFCQSLVAQPSTENYSRLSVNTRLFTESVKMILKVGPQNFTPPPKVDSAVVEIIPKKVDMNPDEMRGFYNLTQVLFSTKNKVLRGILSMKHNLQVMCNNYKLLTGKNISESEMKELSNKLLQELQFQEKRPKDMIVQQFLELFEKLWSNGIIF